MNIVALQVASATLPNIGRMDLCKILALGGNSPLFVALERLGDYANSLKELRLVSKEVSQVAMLGFKTFTLTLRGADGDTDVDRASLLQKAKLRHLAVHLRISGKLKLLNRCCHSRF